jgi:hypothetical protein
MIRWSPFAAADEVDLGPGASKARLSHILQRLGTVPVCLETSSPKIRYRYFTLDADILLKKKVPVPKRFFFAAFFIKLHHAFPQLP